MRRTSLGASRRWLLLVPLLALAAGSSSGGCQARKATPFRTGLDVLVEESFAPLAGKKVAVVTNPTGVDRRLRSVVDLLAEAPGVELAAILGPEHGFRGEAEAGVGVESIQDPRTGAPVHSLYGRTRRPTPEMLDGVDAIVFDIQDIGVRAYTYLSTLLAVMEAAAGAGIEVWVLDRPVASGGIRVEGPVLEKGRESFVGPHALPLRHGLTVGEYARLVNAERSVGADLRVVEMEGYRRGELPPQWRARWIAPSPNIPTPEIALIYAGTVLVEGTNLSEGRGTTRPFRLVGAPWVDGHRLAMELSAMDLPGALFREAWFTPVFSKHEGEICSGIEVHLIDPEAYEPVLTAVALIDAVRRLHPDEFAFREQGFDRLAGTAKLREAIERGVPPREIAASWKADLEDYLARRAQYLLYE
ncbi:MAG: DUF1343 domain-containing protein [Planctomycetes bacterium]|nr:DUF1343 domain-containing protein [Planctomycetota bacterium]